MKLSKKIAVGIMSVAMLLSTVSMCGAESYTNNASFSSVTLPESSGNTTLKSGTKTTSRSYGKAEITSFTHCDSVSVWFRSKVDGEYHYWLPYMVSIDDKSVYHKVKYCDASSAYYAKNVSVNLRAENDTEALNFYTEKVSGDVYFN